MATLFATLELVRADRLLQVLLLLQRRKKVTVAEVAAELEISTRTARRDLEALALSGVPVYSQAGRGGGWSLVGGASTDLTGLTEAEARALFLAIGGGSERGEPALTAALRKLTQALPEPFRAGAMTATESVIVDGERWGHRETVVSRPDHFDVVSKALLDGQQIALGYLDSRGRTSERVVHPLGLIEKRGRWYLVATSGNEAPSDEAPNDVSDASDRRSYRLDRVRTAVATGDAAIRPPDFDLDAVWTQINEEFAANTLTMTAIGWIEPGKTVAVARGRFGRRLTVLDDRVAPDGRLGIEIAGWSHDAMAREVAGFGDQLLVTEPPEVVELLAQLGEQLTATYEAGTRSKTRLRGGV